VSGKIMGEVMRYAPDDLTETQYRVLMALAESARDHNRTTKTNTVEVAMLARRKIGTVRNAISELTRRCLIYPVHPHSEVGRGRKAQDYRIVELHAYHRAATHRPEPTNSVTARDDAMEPE